MCRVCECVNVLSVCWFAVCVELRSCVKRSTGHTHRDREQHPRHRHTHTTKNNSPNPQTNTSHKHLTTLEGGATTVRSCLAFTRYCFTSKLYCWSLSSFYCPPPHLHNLPYCITIARPLRNIRPPPTDPPFFMPCTIQYW